MGFSALFFLNSILLGCGLGMDSFCVSTADGLKEPAMARARRGKIAATFGFFQAAMPLTGWYCVHTIAETFTAFQKFIPWIALGLLTYIGGGMIRDGLRQRQSSEPLADSVLSGKTLFLQGIATSIDALSVGFAIADQDFPQALVCALIIGVVTFGMSLAGLALGRKFGLKLADKASILGGVILIGIGLEIFLTNWL